MPRNGGRGRAASGAHSQAPAVAHRPCATGTRNRSASHEPDCLARFARMGSFIAGMNSRAGFQASHSGQTCCSGGQSTKAHRWSFSSRWKWFFLFSFSCKSHAYLNWMCWGPHVEVFNRHEQQVIVISSEKFPIIFPKLQCFKKNASNCLVFQNKVNVFSKTTKINGFQFPDSSSKPTLISQNPTTL